MQNSQRLRPGGFTLIEAMVVVLIMGVVLAIGVPAFGDLIDKTRVRSAVESVVEAFRIARLTAVQEQTNVIICPLNEGEAATCNGTAWQKGIMIIKKGKNGKPDEVIQRQRFSERLHIFKKQGIESIANQIDINANGWTPGDQTSIFICTSATQARYGQRIIISGAGRIRTESASTCNS